MTEQLNLWKAALQVAFDQTCSVGRPKDWKLIKDALDSVNAALTQPAQPAEGGEAIVLSADVREYLQEGIDNATQCEEADVDYAFAEGLAQLLGPLYTAPPASQEQLTNGLTEAETNATASVMGLTASQEQAQQPSGGEAVAWRLRAPVESCGLQRFMTQAKYEKQTPAIQKWYEPFKCQNCATPKPEPMPLPRLTVSDSHMASLIEAAIQGHASTRDAMRWLVRQLATKPEPMTRASTQDINASRAGVDNDPDELPEPWSYRMGWRDSETHHGITKGAA